MDARTEAAVDALDSSTTLTRERCETIVRRAFAAADAVEAPLAEQLVTALRHAEMVMNAARIASASKLPNTSAVLHAEISSVRDALPVFDAARADSQGTAGGEA